VLGLRYRIPPGDRNERTLQRPGRHHFVRHSAACKYKGEEFCRRCNCRKHLRWTAGGVQYRRSAKARTWVEAERQKQYLIEQMSANNAPATPTVAPTIHSLVEAFVTSKQSQRIGDTTVKRHKRELTRLADFLAENGVFVPNAITAAALYKFRETWKTLYPASSTQREAQQRIRQFLRFLHDDGYLQKLPRLSPIKVDQPPTMPLDDKQYKARREPQSIRTRWSRTTDVCGRPADAAQRLGYR
jgi:integrase/recombinase XerD